jgi:hypothetical protein
MPKLPDALGAPAQPAAAMQDSAGEAAQPYDAIPSILDEASSLYSRFGQGGPPRLTDVANSANDLYGVPYNAGAASGYGYVGNVRLNPVDPSGDQPRSAARPPGIGDPAVVMAALPALPIAPLSGSAPNISLASMFKSQTPVPLKDDQDRPVLKIDGNQMVRPSDVSPNLFVDFGRAATRLDPTRMVGLVGLAAFIQGGPLDVQRVGPGPVYVDEFKHFANVAIGLYAAAAGIPQDVTLFIANRYATKKSRYAPDQKMDAMYPNMSDYGVYGIKLGYRLYQSGSIGP